LIQTAEKSKQMEPSVTGSSCCRCCDHYDHMTILNQKRFF